MGDCRTLLGYLMEEHQMLREAYCGYGMTLSIFWPASFMFSWVGGTKKAWDFASQASLDLLL
jgi:hypothetical protein